MPGSRGELAGTGGGQLGHEPVEDVQVARDLAPQVADGGAAAPRAVPG